MQVNKILGVESLVKGKPANILPQDLHQRISVSNATFDRIMYPSSVFPGFLEHVFYGRYYNISLHHLPRYPEL